MKKGVKYIVEAATAELGAPTEVYIRILDKAGKELVASDPGQGAGDRPACEVTAPRRRAADYRLRAPLGDVVSGPNEVYFLTVKEAKPDFEITLGSDRIGYP